MTREVLQLNKVASPDDVTLHLEGEKPEPKPEDEIQVHGFSQVEEDRKTKYVATDFKLKRCLSGKRAGLWILVRSSGGKVPRALAGGYTKERVAEEAVQSFLFKQEKELEQKAEEEAKIKAEVKRKLALEAEAIAEFEAEQAAKKEAEEQALEEATNPDIEIPEINE